MVKNSLSKSQLAIVIGVMVVVGLVAGVIGSQVTNSVTGNVVLSNNAAGSGTYRIRPEGTAADNWLPYSDGGIYLTTNGNKPNANFVVRKWLNGSKFADLMTINKNGKTTFFGDVGINGSITAGNIYTKAGVDNLISNLNSEIRYGTGSITYDMLVRLNKCTVVKDYQTSGVISCDKICAKKDMICVDADYQGILISCSDYAGSINTPRFCKCCGL